MDNLEETINGNVTKILVENEDFYCRVWDDDNQVTSIIKFDGIVWTILYTTTNHISDFEVVENGIWVGDSEEGLVLIGI